MSDYMITVLSVAPGTEKPYGLSIIMDADYAESLPAWDDVRNLAGERYRGSGGRELYSIYVGEFDSMYDAYVFAVCNGLPDPFRGINTLWATNPRYEAEYIKCIRSNRSRGKAKRTNLVKREDVWEFHFERTQAEDGGDE